MKLCKLVKFKSIFGNKGCLTHPKWMNFWKSSEGGRGPFQIQKFIMQIFAIIDETKVMNFAKNVAI